jgi:hypothetical protein
MLKLILFSIFIIYTVCHVRWVSPKPRSDNSGIKKYPCGNDAFWGNGQPITTLKPGVNIVHYEETINHIGAPFRFALSVGNDNNYDKYILLDHLPHNDLGGPRYF